MGAGGCPNATATRVVTVLALPTVNAGPDVTLCPSQTAVLGIPSGSTSTSPISNSASGNDNSNFTTSVTVTGAPAGATITSITFTPNLSFYGNSCYYYNNWYIMQYWNGTTWVNLTCGTLVTINAFNGSIANGLVFTIRVIDQDFVGDFVTISISNLVANYTNPISYSWSPATNLSSATVSDPTCSATTTTTYTLTATANGCSASDQAVVTVIPGAVAGTLSGTQSACVGATTTFTSNGATGGTWTSSNTAVASVNPSTGIVTGVSAGTSTITYTVLGVSGCPNSTATRVVTIYALPVISAGSDVTICPSSSTVLTGTSNISDTYVYTLNMFDTWGDGWNGGYLTAFINGASIGTYAATGTGSAATINVSAGQTIYFTYSTGSFENENSYSISLNGATVYSTGTNPPSGTVYTNNSHPQTVTYAWSPGTSLSSTTTLSTTYTATTPTVATYTLTVTANGCASTDQVAITVQDLVPPVITCPNNVTVNSASGICGALVQFNAPTVTDDCAPNVLSANLLVNGNGTAGLTAWNITQNGGNGWANSGETALGNGTSFIGSYAWCVKNQVVDLVANGYTTTQLDASPSIIVSEYYKASACCSATDQYFYQAEILNSSFTPIANFNLGSIGAPVSSTAVWQQVNNTFTGYPSGARYVRITHGSKDTEFWGGQYGTVINESKVQVFIPSTLTAVQTAGLASGSTFPVGTTTNTFSATDATGNIATNSFTVTVVDNVPPIAICQNLTVQLNSAGTAAITASQINNGSTDNCAIATLAVSPNTFTCANVGANTVILTVTDIYGNSSTCNATVTVQDIIAPIPICQNITVQLNAAGTVSITGAQINNGSTDNCAIATYSVTPNSFTCGNIGTNAVILTVTDVNGNSSTCNATVTVQDNVAPIAICQNITAQLNASGNTTITAAMVNNGSTDACGIFSTTINTSNFNCSNLGANTVILTVTDNNANSSTCSATVTVVDLVNPFFITTPTNITNTAVANLCGRVIYYTPPTFGDNCSATMSKIDNSGLASGDIFPVGVTTQTYQLTDQSGNTAVYSFTITIVDNQNPIITNCPSNITVNTSATSCNALVSWTAPAISDNCPGVQFTVNHASGSQFSAGTTTVTYTATDASNNTSTCSFTVTVIDNVAPVVPVLPTVTGVCSATATAPTTQDNCSGTITGVTTNPLTYSTQGTHTITWTFTDANANSISATQTVIVLDNISPIITAPSAVSVSANASCSATGVALGTPVTSDNCSAVSTTNNAPSTFPIGNTTVTWTATDATGNTSTATQLVTVTDNTLPSISAPANITVSANASCVAFNINLGNPIATDNCTVSSVTNNAPTVYPLGATTVVWTITDASGNASNVSQTVTVVDNGLPIVVPPGNVVFNATTSCSVTNSAFVLGNAYTTDNCNVASVASNAPASFPIGNTTVTWTVTDNAGNIATATQVVTVVDNTNPTITAPSAVTVNANSSCTATGVALGSPVVTDNCAGSLTTNNAPTTFPLGNTIVTWTVTDLAGHTATATQSVTVVDLILPTITAPANVTVSANSNCVAINLNLGTPVVSDNCSIASVVNNGTAVYSLGTTTITWTVTDGSGNIRTATQTVTVVDNSNPIITAPAPKIVDANAGCTATGVNLGSPVASDNCSAVVITNNAPVAFPIGNTTVTWTATDNVGNTATATQVVTVLDNTNPTITAPSAVTVNANSSCTATGVVLGSPIASDNCTGFVTTNNAPASFPLGQTIVTWTVTDLAGNTATAAQSVTVVDIILPTITAPANVTVSANSNCVAFNLNLGTPVVSDNCSIASVVNNGTAVYALGTTTVTWTVTDGSGNVRTAIQTVTVVDNSNPVITAPAPKIVDANAGCAATGVNLGSPVASDNCSAVMITNNAPVAFPIGNTTVTWTATDNVGNTATATQVVTVLDNTNPTITAPSAVTVNANSSCTATGVVLGSPIASDNCTGFVTTNNAPASFPLGQTIVTWTVTDLAGHTAIATQTVTVVDNQNPTIFAPATVNANTNNSCMALNVNLGTPVTSDNCSVATLVNNAPSAFNVGTTVVTWTVTDGSGLTATATQNVIVSDNEDPIIIAPANINANTTSACSANGINLGTATAFDNCSVATIASNAPASFPVGTTLVVWTATDANGNNSTATQIVVVNDVVNPTITAPSDITTVTNTGCTASGVVIGVPQTADNCGVASVSNNAPVSFPVGITSVIWTVTDVNGNTAFAIQKVTVTDNMMPTLTVAANVTVDANNSCVAFNVNLGTPIVADNCGIATIQNDAPMVYNIGTTTVTWTVTDNNGNTISATQTVTVVDNTVPVIIAPANMQVSTNNNCVASGLILGNPIATDNCTVASIVNDAPLDFPVGTTIVTYTVTDAAGNSATATQTITVSDVVNPTALLQNILVTLDGQGAATISFADIDTGSTDNCGIATTSLSQTDFNCLHVGINNVTVVITDNNDNTTISTVSVTIKTNGIDSDNDGIDDSCDDIADPIEPLIPEAFTPNGNNINEYFVIGNLETFEQRQLNVYNRYGNSVYSSDDYKNDWDGTRSDNGQALPDATYYYVLKLSENDIRKGFVYINRVRQ